MWKQLHIMVKKKQETKYESVKINTGIVEKVRDNKKVTGVPVSTFFEQAAELKLETDSLLGDFNKTGRFFYKNNEKSVLNTKPKTKKP